ncbi:YbaN family protein [Acinetobacter sp. WZC-1]|uniref:YbaN family protein n=1 Tax=Acinetobacter sp. WZC-1 TaxID=3459034 RepID=UPI00403E0FD7
MTKPLPSGEPETGPQSTAAPAELSPPPMTGLSGSRLVRGVYIVLSCLSLSVGVIGIFVPGLPTVEFILLAAFFASRGSERLYLWFYRHGIFGPMIRDWKEYRRISRKAKYMAAVSMSIAALIMLWKIPHPWFVGMAIAGMVCGWLWMWRQNEH